MNEKGEISFTSHHDGFHEFKGTLYKGIFPPPEMMKQYQEVDTSLPNRFMQWAEEETQHRRDMERLIVIKRFRSDLVGQIFAIAAVLIIVGLVYLFLVYGSAEEGKWVAITVIVSLAGIFALKKSPPNSTKEE